MKNTCKRIALLIVAPGQRDRNTYINSIKFTLDSLHSYLLSSAGGSWREDEITILWDDDLLSQNNVTWFDSINLSNCDYLYVHYLGHGFVKNNYDYLALSSQKHIPVSLLYKQNMRQTLVIDACRSPLVVESQGLGDRFLPTWGSYQFDTRILFDDLILSAPLGLAVIQSTKSGDKAWGDALGPLFTQSLLHASSDFARITTPQIQLALIGKMYELAVNNMRNKGINLQTPTFVSYGKVPYPFTIGNFMPAREWG